MQINTYGRIAQRPSHEIDLVPNEKSSEQFLVWGKKMFMGGNGQIRNSKKKIEKGNPVFLGYD